MAQYYNFVWNLVKKNVLLCLVILAVILVIRALIGILVSKRVENVLKIKNIDVKNYHIYRLCIIVTVIFGIFKGILISFIYACSFPKKS